MNAQIFDRGYREYTGPRSGVVGAMRSVIRHSLRAVLGMGRSARHKIIPVLSMAIAYIPAIVFVGIAILLPGEILDDITPDYSDLIGVVYVPVILFCAFAVPEVLVKDRRDGMLSLYLSTPLQRGTYVLSKAITVLIALSIVTIGPPMLQLLGYTFEGAGPDGFAAWLAVFVRIVASGLAFSMIIGSVSLGAASLTDRRAFASVGIILLIFLTSAVGDSLEDAGFSDEYRCIGLVTTAVELVQRIFGESGDIPEISTTVIVLASLGWFAVGAGAVWFRYRKVVAVR